MIIGATRLHGEHVLRDDPALGRLAAFLRGAERAGAAAVLVAVGEEHGEDQALVGAVRKAVQEYQAAVKENRPRAKVVSVHVVPVRAPGFTPALNALTAKAAAGSAAPAAAPDPSAASTPAAAAAAATPPLVVFQSLEITCSAAALAAMRAQFLSDPTTLVVGARLDGHAAVTPGTASGEGATKTTTTAALTGATCPWNTLAMWNAALLSRTGFLQLSDGVASGPVAAAAAGVEEVAVVALHQRLFPGTSRAVLLDCGGAAHVQWATTFAGEARRAWHARKMASKLERARAQLDVLFPERGADSGFEVELCVAAACQEGAATPTAATVRAEEAAAADVAAAVTGAAADAADFPYVTPIPAAISHTATVLVTGGAGFIGSHTAAHLLRRGNKVVIVDEVNDYYDVSQKMGNVAHLRALAAEVSDGSDRDSRLVFVRADINDIPRMTQIFAEHEPAFVVHLAARAGVRPSLKDPYLYIRANILGTTALLEIARKFDCVRHFVYASSSSVYGGSTKETFSEADIVDQPVSPYAATKKSCELMASTFNHLYGLHVSGLRFFTVYGPRGRPDMAPFKFLDRAARGVTIDQYGDGSSERDYTYVDDIVSGVVRAMDRPAGVQVYNLGNGRPVTLKRFIGLVGEVAAPVDGLNINYMPDQPGDVKRTCADISKARGMLGYDPKTPFEVGLRETWRWFQERAAGQAEAREAGEAAAASDADTSSSSSSSSSRSSSSSSRGSGGKNVKVATKSRKSLRVVYEDDEVEGINSPQSSSSEEDEAMRTLSGSGNFDFMMSHNKRSTSAPAGVRPPRFLREVPKRRQFAYE
jgi:UDP-glucuronate 4-epimerase